MAAPSNLRHRHHNRSHQVARLVERDGSLFLSLILPCHDELTLEVTHAAIDTLVATNPRFMVQWASDVLMKEAG